MKYYTQFLVLTASVTLASAAFSEMATAPVTQESTKTFTIVTVGEAGLPAKVTLDTGSSMLVLEQRFVKNDQTPRVATSMNMSYGNGGMNVHGQVVSADVTLNTTPSIVAHHVPILMVPNGTFKDRAGIMGVEMSNQTSVWRHLPSPYNQMMIVNGPARTVSFGQLSDEELNTFAKIQLNEGRCGNGKVNANLLAKDAICFATRTIPVNYTFKSSNGEVVYNATYHTVFDTGGGLTHFYLQPIPQAISHLLQNKNFQGSVIMQIDTDNQGALNLPSTEKITVVKSKRNVVNSGHAVFYNKTVLFDAKDGMIGFK